MSPSICMNSRPRVKDAHLEPNPRFKDIFPNARCPHLYSCHRGVAFLPHGAPKITAVVHLQSCTESGLLLLTLLRTGMERSLPSASGSSTAGLKPCREPTCKFKSQLVTSVHQCPCGRSMHGFCGRGRNNICSTQKPQHRTQQSHQRPQQNTAVI